MDDKFFNAGNKMLNLISVGPDTRTLYKVKDGMDAIRALFEALKTYYENRQFISSDTDKALKSIERFVRLLNANVGVLNNAQVTIDLVSSNPYTKAIEKVSKHLNITYIVPTIDTLLCNFNTNEINELSNGRNQIFFTALMDCHRMCCMMMVKTWTHLILKSNSSSSYHLRADAAFNVHMKFLQLVALTKILDVQKDFSKGKAGTDSYLLGKINQLKQLKILKDGVSLYDLIIALGKHHSKIFTIERLDILKGDQTVTDLATIASEMVVIFDNYIDLNPNKKNLDTFIIESNKKDPKPEFQKYKDVFEAFFAFAYKGNIARNAKLKDKPHVSILVILFTNICLKFDDLITFVNHKELCKLMEFLYNKKNYDASIYVMTNLALYLSG
jgi:hypothetical protein